MDSLNTADGGCLHLHHWPASGPAHGMVQIVHGLGEHMGRYTHVAAALNAAGWHVAGHDHRGHGRSSGPRGSLPADDTLLADLATVMDRLRGPGHHVLLGHSMGGLVAARFVAEALASSPAAWSRPVDGLVLSSPALDAGLGAAQKLLLQVLGPLAPDLRLSNGLDASWVSRDAQVVQAYRADPLVHDRVTPRLVRFIVQGGQRVQALAPAWRVPTLLMWAGADRCVAPAGSEAFAAAAPTGVLQAEPLAGLSHEILNEPERDQVLALLTRWLAMFAA